MFINFENGAQFEMPNYPLGADSVIAGHKRDTLTVTVKGEYSAVKETFNGQGWEIVDDESAYDKSNYTLVASICDNMDGTITVRVGRANTVEEDLRDQVAASNVTINEQNEVIGILAGGVTV